MYFRVEAAHAVGQAYNVVFGNGSIEDTLRSELLLHAFGDVEHAAFVFVEPRPVPTGMYPGYGGILLSVFR